MKTGMEKLLDAFAGHDEEAVLDILGNGFDMAARDENDNTPLHYAAIFGMTKAAEAILDAGGLAMVFNKAGERPLDYARAFGERATMNKIWAAQDGETMRDAAPLPYQSLADIRAVTAKGGDNHLEHLIRAGKMKQVIAIALKDPQGFTAEDFLAKGRRGESVLITLCAEEGFGMLFDRALWLKNPAVFAAILKEAPASEKQAYKAESFLASLHQAAIAARPVPRLGPPKK